MESRPGIAPQDRSESVSQLAAWIRELAPIAAFSGAGISTESGVPDFRSPNGVWARTQPVLYDDFMASPEARHKYWRQKSESHTDMARAEPNAGHLSLARWEETGLLSAVITQNIDGLHQLAGSRRVLELHGTAREIACQDCGARSDADEKVKAFLVSDEVPKCPECDGRLKHATISFGQALPADILQDSTRLAQASRLFLVLGSSLVVEPAASLPRIAAAAGSRLVIINRDPTPLDDLADLVLHESIGSVLSAVDSELTK